MAGHDEVVGGWHKSSTSADASCVEVRVATDNVYIRDTKDRHGAVLTFSHQEWVAFLVGVRRGEFDIPTAMHLS